MRFSVFSLVDDMKILAIQTIYSSHPVALWDIWKI